jgi:hypothetical protein
VKRLLQDGVGELECGFTITDVEEITDFGLPKTKRWFVLRDYKTKNLAGQVLLEVCLKRGTAVKR